MQLLVDCGVFEALWNLERQDYDQIIARSPESDIISINTTLKDNRKDTSLYIIDKDSDGTLKRKKCLSTKIPNDYDVQEASGCFK